MITKDEISEWLKFIPIGWEKSFGKELVDELYAAVSKSKLENYSILDMKEKWGKLEIYDSSGNSSTEFIAEKYKKISYRTCFRCGAKATTFTTGWILPVCPNCKEND